MPPDRQPLVLNGSFMGDHRYIAVGLVAVITIVVPMLLALASHQPVGHVALLATIFAVLSFGVALLLRKVSMGRRG